MAGHGGPLWRSDLESELFLTSGFHHCPETGASKARQWVGGWVCTCVSSRIPWTTPPALLVKDFFHCRPQALSHPCHCSCVYSSASLHSNAPLCFFIFLLSPSSICLSSGTLAGFSSIYLARQVRAWLSFTIPLYLSFKSVSHWIWSYQLANIADQQIPWILLTLSLPSARDIDICYSQLFLFV